MITKNYKIRPLLCDKNRYMARVLIAVFVLFMSSCDEQECRDAVVPVPVELEVHRIDQQLFQCKSASEVETLLKKQPKFAQLFLDADEYPSNQILADRIFQLIQNPSIDTLYQESVTAFNNLEGIVSEIKEALGRLKVYYPNSPTPIIQTAVTGLYKDLVITNEEIIIGMDFFIGENASYPPLQIPEYISKRYTTTHLPANIIQFISSQYIQQSAGETMLAEMIDHGKSYYLLSTLLPCTPEHILMGYSQKEWKDAFENDKIIWANFIENELLYETNHQMKQKFLGERPNVYEIGEECPGRIGRWLGWQIVKSYANRSGVGVKELMAEKDANKIFRLSEYKPSGS